MKKYKDNSLFVCFIQSADIEKIRTAVDEALVQAAENHALLDKINEVNFTHNVGLDFKHCY